ncbi:hypothetical protein Tco_0702478, partial [Tanacetum coccineum]
YTTEADAATKTISFTLSCFDKLLSFDLGVFSSVIGLKPSENCVSVPPKETMKPGLATLGLFDKKHPHLSSTDLINSSLGSHDQLNVNQQTIAYCLCWELEIDIADILFSDPIASLHPISGKPKPKTNISYTRYMSLIMEHLLEDKYRNDDMLSLKPHNTTTTTLNPHLRMKEVNADDITDKYSSRTSVQTVTQSKAPTVRKPMKKKIPSST